MAIPFQPPSALTALLIAAWPAPAGAAPTLLQLDGPALAGPSIGGPVRDLGLDPAGGLYFLTPANLGRVAPSGAISLIATGAFGFDGVGLAVDADGEVIVVDAAGDLTRVSPETGTTTLLYDDLFLINQASDLVIDADGVCLVACRTPSSGVRGIAAVDVDAGSGPADRLWGYWSVDLARQPLALAADALGPALLSVEEDPAQGLSLLPIEGVTGLEPVAGTLDGATAFGADLFDHDGDLALELDGDAWVAAGDTLWRHDRATGNTTAYEVRPGSLLSALVIGPSSNGVASSTGFSLFAIERLTGSNTSTLLEWPGADPPADPRAASIGGVPGQGLSLQPSPIGVNIVSLDADADGGLLYGGDLWGSQAQLRRIDPLTGQSETVAALPDPDGRVEGIEVHPDGRVLALGRDGRVWAVTEDPHSPELLFGDPLDLIAPNPTNQGSTKGLVAARSGALYTVDRTGWATGSVTRIDLDADAAAIVAPVADGRGVAGDPFGPRLLVNQWNSTGFDSGVARLDSDQGTLVPLALGSGINLANGVNWGDGDLTVDAQGAYYTVAEDEFAVWRFDPTTGRRTRMGSGYRNYPGGVTIAPSRPTTPSATGWSLWVHNRPTLFEIPGVPAPAPRWVDLDGPPIGAPVASLDPRWGEPSDVVWCASRASLVVATADARLIEIVPGLAPTVVLDSADGLGGELTALAAAPDGSLRVVARDGRLWSVDPLAGWQLTPLDDDAADTLEDLRGVAVAHDGRLWLSDATPSRAEAGRVFEWAGPGAVSLASWTANGAALAIDPLSGDLLGTQSGSPAGPLGELLRIEVDTPTPRVGHWLPADLTSPRGFSFGEQGGAVAASADGTLYLALEASGEVLRLDRDTRAAATVSSNYERPSGLAVGPGAGGGRLYVLDRFALYAHELTSAPPDPAATPPRLDRLDTVIDGVASFGALTPLELRAPDHAGALYAVFAGVTGKLQGFPLAAVGAFNDPRLLPTDLDLALWFAQGSPSLPGFIGLLDGAGVSPPGTGLSLPAVPQLTGLERFVDLHWLVIDPGVLSSVARISSTSHLYLGLP